ncbi:hypothetical protein PSQ39_07830 [Curvibacter sp. HBC28]|uniref:DUF4174 domain-containing protein n=1 Tax=Curvibacter microcysteis TaxID=3026419 RepID=A0ABT5MEW4_9BURK|nr:hypothetical protein [Curvibacter sp. HBC28]MDD0814534.1 hypothetical protein [Curvibacter sp. HBC28]
MLIPLLSCPWHAALNYKSAIKPPRLRLKAWAWLAFGLLSTHSWAWHPGTPAASFEAVAKRMQSMQRCRQVDRILAVRLVDEDAQPLSPTLAAAVLSQQGVILIAVDTERVSDETFLHGPLKQVPSESQMDSLPGRKTCVG